MAKKDKVVKRNDGVNGTYSKETLDNGSTIELLSRRNPDESVTYTERFITPQQDTSYYVYNNTTPDMDRHVIGGKYVTPTKYNKMGWLGKRIIAGVRPDSWDAKFDSYQEPVDSFQQGGEILKAWGGKKLSEQMSDEDAQALRSGTYRKSYTDEFGNKIEAKPVVWKNGWLGHGIVYRAITPQNDTLYNTVGFDLEPSDAPGYQTVVPWTGEYVHSYDEDSSDWERSESELSKRLSVPDIRQKYRPVGNEPPIPSRQGGGPLYSSEDVNQMQSGNYYNQETLSDGTVVKRMNNYPGEGSLISSQYTSPDGNVSYESHWVNRKGKPRKAFVTNSAYNDFDERYNSMSSFNANNTPSYNQNISLSPMQAMQDGGEIPVNDQQQQLFVAIITDMAKTLGVEPSQEFAEAVLTAFEKQDDSQGLLTLFTKTKDKFMNETGLFREGGKMFAFVEKFKCGGKSPKKTLKKQEGGEVAEEVGAGAGYITTPVNDRQARRAWRQATGGTRREARQAQRNLTNYIESQGGISHAGARNSAAAMMMNPQRFSDPVETPALRPMEQAQINASTPTLSAVQMGEARQFGPTPVSYDDMSFNDAFGAARKSGVGTFTWRGKEYTTELAQQQQQQQQQPQSVVERTIESGSLNSPTVTGVYPDYYYNTLYNVGANLRARRQARRAARNGGAQ